MMIQGVGIDDAWRTTFADARNTCVGTKKALHRSDDRWDCEVPLDEGMKGVLWVGFVLILRWIDWKWVLFSFD